jgi:F-type H+-transporting ATPase subunit b
MIKIGKLAFSFAATLALSGAAFAAEAEHGGEHASGGLPQLNVALFPPQLFWLAVTFAVLLILMWKVGLPNVGGVILAREAKIEGDLAQAGRFKDDADALIAAYDQALAGARSDAQKALATAQAETDADAAKRLDALAKDLAVKSSAADQRIAAAKAQAIDNIRGVAADAARQAVAKLAGVDVDAGAAEAAVAGALKERA